MGCSTIALTPCFVSTPFTLTNRIKAFLTTDSSPPKHNWNTPADRQRSFDSRP